MRITVITSRINAYFTKKKNVEKKEEKIIIKPKKEMKKKRDLSRKCPVCKKVFKIEDKGRGPIRKYCSKECGRQAVLKRFRDLYNSSPEFRKSESIRKAKWFRLKQLNKKKDGRK